MYMGTPFFRGEPRYSGLQRCIDRNLSQYQWTYKRFKWSPRGRRNWYRQSNRLLSEIRTGTDRKALGLHPDAKP